MGDMILNEKRKALQDYKLKLLADIKYIDIRINEARGKSGQIVTADDDSSDSDLDLTETIDLTPSVPELKQRQSHLKTCLLATQELTGLQVLESQVELVVEDPVVEGDPVKEPGNWYEVVAECKMDLVPFLITFFVHKSDRKFGPKTYRNVKVSAVKKAHETELSTSLDIPTKPGDAIELLGNFAACHRSRRSTLARLADKFAHTLHMAPKSEGGYSLKCLDVLDMWWLIKYSKSKASYNHSLKFDIDHMDEKYIQLVKQYYEQLQPTIGTEKRTLLLEKILHTCIESKGTTLEMYESTESDQETIERHNYNQRLLNNQEIQNKNENNQPTVNQDREIMAPPKALPKKTKPKGKENKIVNEQGDNKGVKRPVDERLEEVETKKVKKDSKVNDKEAVDAEVKNKGDGKKKENKSDENVSENQKKTKKHDVANDKATESKKVVKKTSNTESSVKIGVKNVETSEQLTKNTEDVTKTVNKDKFIKKSDVNTKKSEATQKVGKQPNNVIEKTNKSKVPKSVVPSDVMKQKQVVKETTSKEKPKDSTKSKEKNIKDAVASKKSADIKAIPKRDLAETAKVNSDKSNEPKPVQNKRKLSILDRVSAIDKEFEQKTSKIQNVDTDTAKCTKIPSIAKKTFKNDLPNKKLSKDLKKKSLSNEKNIRRGTFTIKDDKRASPKNKIPTIPPKKSTKQLPNAGNGRNLTGVSVASSSDSRISKIPTKTSSFVNAIPVRMSPRKHPQIKPKSSTSGISVAKNKVVTNIPRLLKKADKKNIVK